MKYSAQLLVFVCLQNKQKRNPIHSILYTARQSFEVGLNLPLYECEGNRLNKRSLGHHVSEGRKKQVRRLANGTRW